LCHGFAALRVPDSAAHMAANLWRAFKPAVGRAGQRGIQIDDSKKIYAADRDLTALEIGVRAFFKCANGMREPCPLDLDTLIPQGDLADLKTDFWFEFAGPSDLEAPCKAALLQKALAKTGMEPLAVGARAMSARLFNAALLRGANKADASWAVIRFELKRLAALSGSNESIVVAVDRQGGRKFYTALVGDVFDAALVHTDCESERISIYRIETETRKIIVGFYVDGDAEHLLIALASMAAKLAREKYMRRFNAFFQRHLPDLKPTAGYYNDAGRFLEETKELRLKLGIEDGDFIRAK
jgi:hypothetical protein